MFSMVGHGCTIIVILAIQVIGCYRYDPQRLGIFPKSSFTRSMETTGRLTASSHALERTCRHFERPLLIPNWVWCFSLSVQLRLRQANRETLGARD